MGAGRGRDGTVLVVTLGTGIGSALFVDGRLVPNTELGHLQVGSEEAEQRASARIRVERGLSWQAWAGEVNAVLAEMHRLLWPDLFIIGGGVTENWELFGSLLESGGDRRRALRQRCRSDRRGDGGGRERGRGGVSRASLTRPNCPMSARPSLR